MLVPDDPEQRNIIDKLANFVARNGPKFEDLTKTKQKDNPRFGFLFGGDYHEYYKWKVKLENQQVEAQKTQQAYQGKDLPDKDESKEFQQEFRSGDRIGETMVSASDSSGVPKDLVLQDFEPLLQKLMEVCTKDNIQNGKNWIVSNAKSAHHMKFITRFLLHRMFREKLPFQQKLHIIYLMNDILHHSRRREMPVLQQGVVDHVVPIVIMAHFDETKENQEKLLKVLKIWETNKFFDESVLSKIRDPGAAYNEFKSLLDRERAIMDEEAKAAIKSAAEQKVKESQEKVQQLEKVVRGSTPNVPAASQDPYRQGPFPAPIPPDVLSSQPPPLMNTFQQPPSGGFQYNQFGQWGPPQPDPYHYFGGQYQQQPPSAGGFGGPYGPGGTGYPYQQFQQFGSQPPPPQPPMPPGSQPSDQPKPIPTTDQVKAAEAEAARHETGMDPHLRDSADAPSSQAPPGLPPPSGPFPGPPFQGGPHMQFYRGPPQDPEFPPYHDPHFGPPPGFEPSVQQFDYGHQPVRGIEPLRSAAQEPVVLDYAHGKAPMPDGAPPIREPFLDPTIPQAAYYDLPAGLMVPLIKLWDCEYKPLDPKDLRLPVPQPPSERLLAAVEAFYSPPSHDRPRDSQGWEKNGLFEYYKAKLKYIKDKERQIQTVQRSPSPPNSASDLSDDEHSKLVRERKPSRSPPPARDRSPKRRSPSPFRKRSASVSPARKRSRSRSRGRSYSRSPPRKRSYSKSRSRSKSRSPARHSPLRRSPTPEQGFIGFTESRPVDARIEESNVGHQLLKKMGWGGQGLGRNESGIVDPIKGGEIRDKQDQFKGIGVNMNDPFEHFRKNKSYTFNRTTAEARAAAAKPKEKP